MKALGKLGSDLEATPISVHTMGFLKLLYFLHDGSSSEQMLTRDVKDLRSELDKLKLVSQKPIHYIGEFDESPSFENTSKECLTQEELNYIGKQNRYQRFNNFNTNNNLSYRSTNVANPQDQVYPSQRSFAPKPQFQSSFQPKQQFFQQQQSYGQQQQPVQSSNCTSQSQQQKYPPGFSQQPMGQQQLSHQAPVQNQQMGPDMCGILQKLLQGQQRVESQYASMQQEIKES
ncbi:glutenin, low molecular weight subunit-like [Eutrema salsugineum]|uniref:glutenin, low molecular weight subunit-like n=1 Tax=Eutrema salsugineum TaxID=72664 RepID=UPI000CED0F44|nr:glutenin, low molecular weight subunit-like [Eutrema salsugineum]